MSARLESRLATDAPLSEAECRTFVDGFARMEAQGGPQRAAAYNRALVLETCGQSEEAARVYAGVLPGESTPRAHNNLARLELHDGNLDRGIELLRLAVDLDPQYRPARTNLGLALLRRFLSTGERADALRAGNELRRALALRSDDVRAREGLARLHYGLGKAGDPAQFMLAAMVAEQSIEVLSQQGQTSAELHNILGLVLAERDANPNLATRSFRRAVEIDPDHAEAHMNLALISLRFRGFETARDSVLAAMDDPRFHDDPEALLALGVSHRGLREFGAAETAFRRAAELSPGDGRPWFNLGILYQEHLSTEDGLEIGAILARNEAARDCLVRAKTLAASPAQGDEAGRRIRQIAALIEVLTAAEQLQAEAEALAEEDAARARAERERLLELERAASEATEKPAEQSGDVPEDTKLMPI